MPANARSLCVELVILWCFSGLGVQGPMFSFDVPLAIQYSNVCHSSYEQSGNITICEMLAFLHIGQQTIDWVAGKHV